MDAKVMERDAIYKEAKSRQKKKDKKKDDKKGKDTKKDKKGKKSSKNKPEIEEKDKEEDDDKEPVLNVEEQAKVDGLEEEIREIRESIEVQDFGQLRLNCHSILFHLMRLMIYGMCQQHQSRKYNQYRYDASHIYMVHLNEFNDFMLRDTPMGKLLWQFIENNEECKKFLITYHLHTMINFERRYNERQFNAES